MSTDDVAISIDLLRKRIVQIALGEPYADDDGSDDVRGRVVQLLPAPGWRACFYEGDDKPVRHDPLIGWALQANGAIEPRIWDGDGCRLDEFEVKWVGIRGPDQPDMTHAEASAAYADNLDQQRQRRKAREAAAARANGATP